MTTKEMLRGCIGKVTFITRRHSKMVAEAKTKTYGKPTRAYRCDYCKRWHLTTRPKEN